MRLLGQTTEQARCRDEKARNASKNVGEREGPCLLRYSLRGERAMGVTTPSRRCSREPCAGCGAAKGVDRECVTRVLRRYAGNTHAPSHADPSRRGSRLDIVCWAVLTERPKRHAGTKQP